MPYTHAFFATQKVRSLQSAREVVPVLTDLVKPTSVIDVGCATGTWLSVFRKLGVENVLGIDGAWVGHDLLEIPREQFIEHDLTQPLQLSRQFDLALSLEVAEHLPESAADSFINTLTQLAPVVAFSAAIPFQGGNHHVNEQWQSYWADKFKQRKYVALDCVRPVIWNNANIVIWYRQNLLVYVHRDHLLRTPHLEELYQQSAAKQIDVVHPEYLNNMGVGMLMRLFPRALTRTLNARMKRLS